MTTGKERDSESGVDYFGARYYGSALGRFTSPDWSDKPEAVSYTNREDPQTLNLYGYVRNNPLAHPDANGHCCDAVFDFLEQTGEAIENSSPPAYGQIIGKALVMGGTIGATLGNSDIQQGIKSP